jgi:hypothetical protein
MLPSVLPSVIVIRNRMKPKIDIIAIIWVVMSRMEQIVEKIEILIIKRMFAGFSVTPIE